MKITAGNVTKEQDIAAETTFLSVPWSITEGEEILLDGVQGFAIETTETEITDFLKRTLENYQTKLAGAEASIAAQKALDNAELVASAITGTEITNE